MIIATCGYGTSGASAVVDFLRGFDGFQEVDLEFQIVHQPDGLNDLKYHLTKSRERVSCNAAIQRFRKMMLNSITADQLSLRVGSSYRSIVDKYISSITISNWNGKSAFDPPEVAVTSENRFRRYLQGRINAALRKIDRKKHYPKFKKRYFSLLTEGEFDGFTKAFIQELFDEMGLDHNNNIILDMLFSATNPDAGLEFFNDCKPIVIMRDPRDTYIRLRENPVGNSFMPQGDVKMFIDYYKRLMELSVKSENALYIQYEDLIYKYYETTDLIRRFIGIENKPQNEFKYFNPNVSVKYTNLAPRYPMYAKECEQIEHSLAVYLYHFPKYKPLSIEMKYEGTLV